MSFYGDVTEAASLAGLDSSKITTAMQQVVDDYIDAEINKDSFKEITGQVDYYDIERTGQSWLILKHMPVISISSVIDNQRANNPVTLATDSYVVDLESDIIQLDAVNSNDYTNAQDYFTFGKQSVKVTYDYGYEFVPDIIQSFANLLIAKWAEFADQQSTLDGLKSVQIGDYKESFDNSMKNVSVKYDSQISGLLNRAKAIYGRGV